VQTYVAAVAGLFLLGFAPPARADQQQDQSACMADAQVFCAQFIPDRVRVAHCLMANRRHISAPCRIALKRFK
jgi:hypothetical protein